MKKAIIFHGAGNNSQGNWFPWLKKQLEQEGYAVSSPDLPNTDKPIQTEWLDYIFKNKTAEFDSETVMIGHSAGATLILRILEKLPENIKINKAVLVAGPVDKGEFPEYFQYKEDLTKNPFEWEKIKEHSRKFYFIASDNDPYDCGERHARVMQEKLGGEMIIKQGQGHFNLEVGEQYKEFPLLMELI